jgi:multidrug efflux pump subunit AcrB
MAWCLNHGGIVIAAAVALLAACVLLVVFRIIGLQLFPQLDSSKFYIDIKTPPGSTLEETSAAAARIEAAFQKSPYVDHYILNLGSSGTRVEIDDRVFYGSNIARFIVDLKPLTEIDKSHKQVIDGFRKKFGGLFSDGTQMVFLEKYLGPPVGAPINIQVSGDDYDRLETVTAAVRRLLEAEPGVVDVKDDMPGRVPQVTLRTKQRAMGRLGLTTRELGGFIFLSLTGYKIGEMSVGREKRDIFLKIDAGQSGNIANMQNQKFSLPGGEEVAFGDLLEPEFTRGLSGIEHENGRRTVTIEANVAKGVEAERIVSNIEYYLPAMRRTLESLDPEIKSVDIRFAGETMLMDKAYSDLVTAVLVSLALIYIILLLEFRSTLQPLIILVCVPYALVGVILGLLIMGYSFSILAGIGLLCLIGIVVNNGIIYIDYANLLQARGQSRREACLEACLTRLRPIVLTKITVILGITPMALASASKTQFWKPLCWSIIWGLLIATTLTLVIIPVAYYITEGWRERYYNRRANTP